MHDEQDNKIVEVSQSLVAEHSGPFAEWVTKYFEEHKIPLNESVLMIAYVLLYASEQTDAALEILNEERTAMVFLRSEGNTGRRVAPITDDVH